MKWLKVQIELVGCIWDGSGERERERQRPAVNFEKNRKESKSKIML